MKKYQLKYFISCETATSYPDMVTTIGLHLGLEPSSRLSKAIVRHLEQCGPCLIVLDNFETPWEPMKSRGEVEDLLCLLTAITSLALLVTMRGAERPGKVKWNRPFLRPFEPLSLLPRGKYLLNLPLAVSLMANVASVEGYSNTLARWETENTALLSDGNDKRSNLEKFISFSINSPRISSSPYAKHLISLLSLLPDGITPEDMMAAKVPLPDVRQCQSVLVGTSLAYIDVKGRLKALSPVREYVRRSYPPSAALGNSPLLRKVPRLIEETDSATLRWKYRCRILRNPYYDLMSDPDSWIEEGIQYFEAGSAPIREAVDFYNAVAHHYIAQRYWNISKATEFNKHAFTLAQQADNIDLQLVALETEQYIANPSANPDCCCSKGNPHWIIKVVHKARSMAGLRSTCYWGHSWCEGEAWAHFWMGNLGRAAELCMQAEESLMPGLGGSDQYLGILDLRGNILWLKSEYLEAHQVFTQMVQKTSPTRSAGYHALALCGMVEMEILMEGETADVLSNLNAAKTVYMSADSPRIVWCSVLAAKNNLMHGDTEIARVSFLECLSKSRGILPAVVQDCLAALADPGHKMYGTMDTFRWAVVYFAFTQKDDKPADRLEALRRLADVHIMMGDDDTALHLFQAALKGGTIMGIHRLRAECMVGIGDIVLRSRDTMQAMDMWEAAHPLFVRSSRRKDAALVKQRLQKLSQSIRDGANETLTTPATVVFPSSLERPETLSAPGTSPSLQTDTDEGPGTSPDEQKEPLTL
ncbi:hypothetical protein B0H13DRAFT_1901571 [Mycena leptocephala]|nr:hypothetical protein B0H13DRAFT_1901571 [Mycena leptocephala]